jgi:hypothetical protein
MKRKVKKVVKEGEEKDSLLNDFKIKSQAAMEYLMTYGWAILIIALTLAVLYSLGIMNPKNFLPRAPPGSCFVFRPNGPGTTDFVSLQGTCGYLPMYVGSFDGVNGYINAPILTFLTTGKVTIVAWCKSIGPTGARQSVVSAGENSGTGAVLASPSEYGDIRFWVNEQSQGWVPVYTPFPGYNQWLFVVGTYDGSYLKIYVNGVLKAIVSLSGSMKTPTSGITIGARNSNNMDWFKGSTANVQIYNTALTDQEIQYLYQQGLGGGPVRLQNLVGWWPLNGDAKDYSGNNNHGTIYGGVTFVQNYNPP